ncbi:MerR family transcriptional regulator [Tsukamurella sp. 1534]|uniref:MerR family transcriptional regulator n=1 Tax=Tsukamurella sp. 1534 TaxID=1151061 RepID=UPI0009D92612|nr:MerR family transcriptional regulator [Tsukamurella sp. 1534]
MNPDISVIVKPAIRMRDLCARTGATPRMIRHYEKTGILAPGRQSNGYRAFTEEDVQTVLDARCLIEAGLSATETAELVGIVCGEGVPPEELDAALVRIAERRTVLDERIDQLVSARAKLDELRDHVQENR